MFNYCLICNTICSLICILWKLSPLTIKLLYNFSNIYLCFIEKKRKFLTRFRIACRLLESAWITITKYHVTNPCARMNSLVSKLFHRRSAIMHMNLRECRDARNLSMREAVLLLRFLCYWMLYRNTFQQSRASGKMATDNGLR